MEKEGPRKTDYLNLSALLKAERNGYFDEQLALQRGSTSKVGAKAVLKIIKLL